MVKSPVLLLVYNRLDTLRQVWAMLERVRPPVLFISGDGAKNTLADKERVSQVQKFLQSNVTWRCDVYYRFLPENAGCKVAVSSGITWFFSEVEAGIILEDDALPHPSFFRFMDEMLERYAQDHRIGTVSGTQLYPSHPALAKGWDFTRVPFIWGWGTWRRVWSKYEVHPPDWSRLKAAGFPDCCLHGVKGFGKHVRHMMDQIVAGKVDTWDYQLLLLMLREGQLNIIPEQNLVRNLGHGHPLAAHVRKVNWTSFLPLQAWKGGQGPLWIQPNVAYERDVLRSFSLMDKIEHKIRSLLYIYGILRFPPDDPLE